MSDKLEMEMKLVVAKKNLPKLLENPLIKKTTVSGSKKTLNIENYYYDTEDYRISNEGMAYRIRKTGNEYEATIKTQNESSGGFSAREEYNVALAKKEVIISGFDKKIDSKLEKLLLGAELQVMFEVHVTRKITNLKISEDTTLEMAVDEGEILAGEKRAFISEVELEILEGNKKDLFAFVAKLAEKVPLYVESKSKFRRGLELLNGTEGVLKKPSGDLAIEKNGNVEVEIKKFMTFYAAKIIEEQNFLREKDNLPSADKLMLTDIKRLRAIVNFACPLLAEENYKYYREIIIELNDPLQELYVLKRFIRQWKRISKNNLMVLKSSKMLGCLEDRQEIILKKISKQVNSGLYSQGMFKLLANVESTTWDEAKSLQLNEFALKRLKDWYDALVKIKITNEKLDEGTARKMRRIIESMIMVRNDIKMGRLDKEAFIYLKALNRNIKVLCFDVYGHKNILAFLQDKNNRGLYRDAGLLLGYRLSEMPKAWRKVRKSWVRFLKVLKKK